MGGSRWARLGGGLVATLVALGAEAADGCGEDELPWADDVERHAPYRCSIDAFADRCGPYDRCLVGCMRTKARVTLHDGVLDRQPGGCADVCGEPDASWRPPEAFVACTSAVSVPEPGWTARPPASAAPPSAAARAVLGALAAGADALRPLCSTAAWSRRFDGCPLLLALAREKGAPTLLEELAGDDRRALVLGFPEPSWATSTALPWVVYMDHGVIEAVDVRLQHAETFAAGRVPARPDPDALPDDPDVRRVATALAAPLPDGVGPEPGEREARATLVGRTVARTWRLGDVGVACLTGEGEPWLLKLHLDGEHFRITELLRGWRTCTVELDTLLYDPPPLGAPDLPARRFDPGGFALGDPILMGALDRDAVDAVLGAQRTALARCRPGPGGGTFAVKFTITKDGKVTSARTEGAPPEAGACAVAIVEKLRFPKPEGGGIVIASYPLWWRAAGR